MYTAGVDPYCYPDTNTLINIPNLKDESKLEEFEAAITAQRADEGFPPGVFDVDHYKLIHHHLFQDVYSWAGEYRTVRISKGVSSFCYPENIPEQMQLLFQHLNANDNFKNLGREEFATKLADFLSSLNAIHPFREGNGRIQNIFITLLSESAGHRINFDQINPDHLLETMVTSFNGNNHPLQRILLAAITD